MVVTSTEFLQCDCLIMNAMCSCCVCLFLLLLLARSVLLLLLLLRLHVNSMHCELAVHQFECGYWTLCVHKQFSYKSFSCRSANCVHIHLTIERKTKSTWTSLCEAERSCLSTIFTSELLNSYDAQRDRYVNKIRKAFQIRGMINTVNVLRFGFFSLFHLAVVVVIDSIDRFLFVLVYALFLAFEQAQSGPYIWHIEFLSVFFINSFVLVVVYA